MPFKKDSYRANASAIKNTTIKTSGHLSKKYETSLVKISISIVRFNFQRPIQPHDAIIVCNLSLTTIAVCSFIKTQENIRYSSVCMQKAHTRMGGIWEFIYLKWMCKKYFIKMFRPNKNHKAHTDKGRAQRRNEQWENKAIKQYKYHFLFIKF